MESEIKKWTDGGLYQNELQSAMIDKYNAEARIRGILAMLCDHIKNNLEGENLLELEVVPRGWPEPDEISIQACFFTEINEVGLTRKEKELVEKARKSIVTFNHPEHYPVWYESKKKAKDEIMYYHAALAVLKNRVRLYKHYEWNFDLETICKTDMYRLKLAADGKIVLRMR
jgi:hypothetical protein